MAKVHPSLKSRKCWYRISLFKAFVVLTLLCVVIGSYGRIRARGLAQRDAIKELQRPEEPKLQRYMETLPADFWARCYIVYDFQLSEYEQGQSGIATFPDTTWLGKLLGTDFIHSVALIEFGYAPDAKCITHLRQLCGLQVVGLDYGLPDQEAWDELMRYASLRKIELSIYQREKTPVRYETEPNNSELMIAGTRTKKDPSIKLSGLSNQTRLRELGVMFGRLSSENLGEIAKTKSLKTLRLLAIQIPEEDLLDFPLMENLESFFWKPYLNVLDDDEFRFIEQMPNLKRVAMTGAWEVSDRIFDSLGKLKHLEELSLHNMNFTGSNLQQLAGLPLKKLELGVSLLDDEALAQISNFQRLEHLEIGSTDVTDAGMKSVAQLTKLRHLSIRDTEVGDEGLRELSNSQALRYLRIRDTKITAAGIADFRQRCPNCMIDDN